MFPFQADNHQAHNAPLLPQTCLSAAPHDDRVSDVTLHYFGCLRRSQRRRFFESLSPAEQQRLARERHKVERRRAQVEQLLLEEAGLFSPQYPAGAKPPPMDTSNAASKLRDFKEHMAEYRRVKGWPSAEQRARHYDGAMEGLAVRADEGVDADIKAPVVFFRDGAGCDVPGLPGSFPNQKVTIAELLGGPSEEARRHGGGNNGVNPLTMPIDDNVVRYIHLPANNMAWVEEAVARYYGERRPTADEMLFNSRRSAGLSARTRTERLLRHEFWRGQQGFDAHSEVHARHMRPMCSPVSIDPVTKEVLPRNLVLFMPYLHWETDRGRMLSAESIKEVNRDKFRLASVADVVNKASHNKDGSGNGGAHNNGQSMQAVGHRDFPHTRVLATSTTTTFGGTASSAPSGPHAPAKLYADKAERRRLLGSVLRTAAVLLEALEFRTEARLIGTYLHGDAPLHPRRTLDQSYYGALKNTGTRDRDQVVYRATTPQPHDCYEHLDERTGKCRQCLEDIKKVPRLIMVDQLWLWILDEKTVITAFPRRWSKNRPDPSAVHKTLRLRLRDARRGEISSAYDLALIIIDECSRVFFDRTRTDERKPNLLDMFADAIRDVTYKQTAAFDQFLIYTHLAGREYRLAAPGGPGGGQGHSDMSTQNTLLNINPEGNLLKEIKDIMDEIHIIARIKAEQQDVMEALVRHIRHVVLPKTRASGSSSSRTGAAGSWDAVLGAVSGNGLDGEHVDAAEADRQREQREQARWTLARADQLLKDMAARSGELEALLENARNTSAALKDLLTLKQQQAGVIEAREAVKQAAETLRQGQSIMLFTVVTIVFLPLSFFATLFGMNASDFTDGSHLSLMHELLFMLPISAGIIVVAFVLAFSRSPFMSSLAQLIRNAFSLVYNTAVTWLLVKSGMYMLGRQMALKAARLSDREAKITGMMKAEVLRKRNNLEKLRAMRRIAVPPRDDDDSTGMRTPRTHSPFVQTPTTSTPMMGVEMRRNPWRDGRSTPKGSVTMYDVEMGQRNASTANLVER